MEEKETPENTDAKVDEQDPEVGVDREEVIGNSSELSHEIEHYNL